MNLLRVCGVIGVCLLAACHASSAPAQLPSTSQARAIGSMPVEEVEPSPALVTAARRQIGVTRMYDPAYVSLAYPGGDVAAERGVCTDVVVRALRAEGLDLQQAMHEDMRKHFADYPQLWGLTAPNTDIDHRRVPNQMHWFKKQGWSQPVTARAADYAAGDIVAWKLNSGPLHIGIVSDRLTGNGTPLVIHNIGNGTVEDDLLFQHTIIGHYRPKNL